MLALLAKPEEHWRPRRSTLVMPLVICMALVIGFFTYAKKEAHQRIDTDFQQTAETATQNLLHHLQEVESFSRLTRGFVIALEEITAQEFRDFTAASVRGAKLVNAISWYQTEDPANWRQLHKAVLNPGHCNALEIPAIDLKAANDRILVRQLAEPCQALMLYLPIYSAQAELPEGVIVALIDAAKMFDDNLLADLPETSHTTVKGMLGDERPQLLLDTQPEIIRYAVDTAFRPSSRQQFTFGDSHWHIQIDATNAYAASRYGWSAWAVLSGGLLFTSLLCIGLLVMTGRHAQTESLVDQRTSELASQVEERIRTQHLLALQNQVLEMVARDALLEDILNKICTEFESVSQPGSIASVTLTDNKTNLLKFAAIPSLQSELVEGFPPLSITDNSGSCGTAAYRGAPVFCNDVATDPEWKSLREFAEELSIKSCWSIPYFDRAGNPLGTFALTHTTKRTPTERDITHMRSAVFLCSLAVEQANASKQINTLSLAVEQSPTSVLMLDLEGRVE